MTWSGWVDFYLAFAYQWLKHQATGSPDGSHLTWHHSHKILQLIKERKYTYTHTHRYISIHICIHIYRYTYIHIQVCNTCICVYIYTFIHKCIYLKEIKSQSHLSKVTSKLGPQTRSLGYSVGSFAEYLIDLDRTYEAESCEVWNDNINPNKVPKLFLWCPSPDPWTLMKATVGDSE